MLRACTDVEWFEDYRVGDEYVGETVEFTEEEIIAFAEQYDPQPFHVDRVAAMASEFGGIIASGTHLLAAVWGAMMRAGFLNGRSMGAPGVEMRVLRPVRPGDTLTVRSRVRETRPSRSRGDRGYVHFETVATNQDGEITVKLIHQQNIKSRPSE